MRFPLCPVLCATLLAACTSSAVHIRAQSPAPDTTDPIANPKSELMLTNISVLKLDKISQHRN